MSQYVILITPEPTREYGLPEAIGPFANVDIVEDHLLSNLEVEPDYNGVVIPLENPSA